MRPTKNAHAHACTCTHTHTHAYTGTWTSHGSHRRLEMYHAQRTHTLSKEMSGFKTVRSADGKR